MCVCYASVIDHIDHVLSFVSFPIPLVLCLFPEPPSPICSLSPPPPPHPYSGTSKTHTLDSQGCGQLTARRLSTPPSVPSRTGVHSASSSSWEVPIVALSFQSRPGHRRQPSASLSWVWFRKIVDLLSVQLGLRNHFKNLTYCCCRLKSRPVTQT